MEIGLAVNLALQINTHYKLGFESRKTVRGGIAKHYNVIRDARRVTTSRAYRF